MQTKTDNDLQIRQKSPDYYFLSGDLTFATIDHKTLNRLSIDTATTTVQLDMQAIGKTDSAGLALILEWTKQAKNRQTKIVLLNLPEQLLAIARLSGLDVILNDATKAVSTH